VPTDEELGLPIGTSDEHELLLAWLRFQRGAVLRKVDRRDEPQARRHLEAFARLAPRSYDAWRVREELAAARAP